jgi:hypothetical protein
VVYSAGFFITACSDAIVRSAEHCLENGKTYAVVRLLATHATILSVQRAESAPRLMFQVETTETHHGVYCCSKLVFVRALARDKSHMPQAYACFKQAYTRLASSLGTPKPYEMSPAVPKGRRGRDAEPRRPAQASTASRKACESSIQVITS